MTSEHRPPLDYQKIIGTYQEANEHVSQLEQHWPFTDKVEWRGMTVCNLKTGEGMAPFMESRDQLILRIHDEVMSSLYYLLVLDMRRGGMFSQNDPWQAREAIRIYEFLFGHHFSSASRRATKMKLEDMSVQELRAVLEMITDTFENLC